MKFGHYRGEYPSDRAHFEIPLDDGSVEHVVFVPTQRSAFAAKEFVAKKIWNLRRINDPALIAEIILEITEVRRRFIKCCDKNDIDPDFYPEPKW